LEQATHLKAVKIIYFKLKKKKKINKNILLTLSKTTVVSKPGIRFITSLLAATLRSKQSLVRLCN
jgi:hypothetical protein